MYPDELGGSAANASCCFNLELKGEDASYMVRTVADDMVEDVFVTDDSSQKWLVL